MSSAHSNYQHEIDVAVELAREAGALLLEYYKTPLQVDHKDDAGHEEPVTEADRAANDLIVSRLRREFPDDGILAEESIDTGHRLQKSRVWLIDPMDGTKSFIAHDDDFAVQIGLAVDGVSIVGAVYQPVRGILYRAAQDDGAWIEQAGRGAQRMLVSRQSDPHKMILASSRSHRSPRMERVVRSFGFKNEVRRGSVGIKVGLIAEQHADAYIHLSPRTKQWDVCAPEIILREAGGLVTDLFGEPLPYNAARVENPNGIVATNGVAHEMVIENLSPLLAEFGRAPV
ncbi:MAG TPA: 3'(2'),5'-bisphosphate nucleotidase CysQ [Pyrinomonadaceae bacterium]|nr:3'(2'),5'-bisphosphate nucleotidase CysQ [Pyrinomonadaceae bacterium]